MDHNTSPDDSEGWTIVLMDRATRFILVQECGRKDRKLFLRAMKKLCQVIKSTKSLSLITDGERRYGNILFELCSKVLKTSKPGRPRKTLPKGIKVRVKNKGDQSKKQGRKRPKYQSPQKEHPETKQDILDHDIHANHVEGQNGAIRRRNSTFRRRTNTYAKNCNGLQRTLDLSWVYHNFVKQHFTTKLVPAVSLGIISSGLTIMNLLEVQLW